MAHGRPDYSQGQLLGLASPFSGQYYYQDYEEGEAAQDDTVDLCDYDVPATRLLYVTGVVIGSDSLARNKFQIVIDAVVKGEVHFVGDIQLMLNSSCFYEIQEGSNFKIVVYNYDNNTKNFAVTVFGFEEVILAE